MQARKSYEQLHAEERFVIAREVLQGTSLRTIVRISAIADTRFMLIADTVSR